MTGCFIYQAHNEKEADCMDRDQLYFDRVHASILILHQRRYLSRSRHSVKAPSRISLQHAMWTLAALLSAQFQHLQESLYQETKHLLELLSLENRGHDPVDTEEVQAWILLATYESMRTYHQQAWMSAGRAFRLVQLMRLHEIDIPSKDPVPETQFIETEEKRRVFWMAYLLDHLFSMRNNWPVTLNEHVVGLYLRSKMWNVKYLSNLLRSAHAFQLRRWNSKGVCLCWETFYPKR